MKTWKVVVWIFFYFAPLIQVKVGASDTLKKIIDEKQEP